MRTRHTAFASPPLAIQPRAHLPVPDWQEAAPDDEHGCPSAESHGQALNCASTSTDGVSAAEGGLQPGSDSNTAEGSHRLDKQLSGPSVDATMRRAGSFAGAAAALARAIAGRLQGKATATPSPKPVVASSGVASENSAQGDACLAHSAAPAPETQAAARQSRLSAGSADGQPDRKRRRGEDGGHPPAQRRCADCTPAPDASGSGTDPAARHGTAARRRCGWLHGSQQELGGRLLPRTGTSLLHKLLQHQHNSNALAQRMGKAPR